VLCPVVVAWYILTELGSIIENAGKLGAPIPPFLKGVIALFKSTVEKAGDKMGGQDK
jgi:phage-related holin